MLGFLAQAVRRCKASGKACCLVQAVYVASVHPGFVPFLAAVAPMMAVMVPTRSAVTSTQFGGSCRRGGTVGSGLSVMVEAF